MKSEKKENTRRNKIRTTINLDEDVLTRSKEMGLNLSRFAEKSLNWLFSEINNGNIHIIDGNTLILRSESEKTAKNEWSRRDSNPLPPACKACSNLGLDFENTDNLNELNNPKKISTLALSKDLRGDPYMSIGEFMKDKKDKFLAFCLHTKPATTGLSTRNDYYNALMKMTDIYTPEDVAALGTTTKTVLRALSKFYGFIETKYFGDGYNGYTKGQWKGNQKEANYAVGSRAGNKTKDLSNEEVRAGYDKLKNPETKLYYLLAACSGARSEHLYRWLSSSDRKIEELPNNIIRADVRDTSSGTKHEAYFYFPAELREEIDNFRPLSTKGKLEQEIQAAGTKKRKINISSLRKWNFNLLLHHMPQITANAVQGRAMRGIDEMHYFDAAGSGAEYYPAAADVLRVVLLS